MNIEPKEMTMEDKVAILRTLRHPSLPYHDMLAAHFLWEERSREPGVTLGRTAHFNPLPTLEETVADTAKRVGELETFLGRILARKPHSEEAIEWAAKHYGKSENGR